MLVAMEALSAVKFTILERIAGVWVGRAPGTESLDFDKLPLFPVRIKPASGDAMIISSLRVDSDISPRVELREVSERER